MLIIRNAALFLFGFMAAAMITPIVVNGDHVASIEIGLHRIAWTPYGWSYQYDWRHSYFGDPKARSGFWPWYDPDRGVKS